jgi:hypothetical protein
MLAIPSYTLMRPGDTPTHERRVMQHGYTYRGVPGTGVQETFHIKVPNLLSSETVTDMHKLKE